MPNLDRLASRGVVFTNATTVSPMTRPTVAALLTGLAPDRSGVRNNVTDRLGKDVPTLAAIYRGRGSATAAFVTTPFVSYVAGFDRGFDVFDGPDDISVGPTRYGPPVVNGEKAVRSLAAWISALPRERSFFAWVHLADLHSVAIWGSLEEASGLYRSRLGVVDAALGAAFDAIEKAGRSAETEIVVVGTHGTHLGEKGARGDSFWLDAAALRVPLVWAGKALGAGRGGGRKDPRRVALPDLAMTLASLAGGALDSRAEGEDLLGGHDSSGSRRRQAWSWATDDQFAWPPMTAAEDADGTWRAFDSEDLAESRSQDGATKRPAAARPARPRSLALSPETRQKLLDAGIVLGRQGPVQMPAPERRNATIEKLLKLRALAAALAPRKTVAEFDEIEKVLPGNLAALVSRIYYDAAFGQVDSASSVAARLLTSYPDRPDSLHWAAHAWWIAKDYSKVQALLEATLSIGVAEPEVHYDLACLRAVQKDMPAAMAQLREAVDAGYRNWSWMERDADLASLRKDPGWVELRKAHGR